MKTKEQVVAEKSMWDKPVQPQEDITLYNIASVKAYNYCMEYDKYSGREVEKLGSMYLRQGYVDGFLAGITHKLTGGHDD